MYTEELGGEFGDPILTKIADLRKDLGIAKKFVPKSPVWQVPDFQEDPLFLRAAFEDRDYQAGTQEQLSVVPRQASTNELEARSRSRSPSPENDSHSVEKPNLKKGQSGPNSHEQSQLERIEERDESSAGRADRKAEDSGPRKSFEVPTLKEIGDENSERLSVAIKTEIKIPELPIGSKVFDDQNQSLLPSPGRSSPKEAKSSSRSNLTSKVQTPSKSLTRKNSGKKIVIKDALMPPQSELTKDDLPTIRLLVKNMLKSEYVNVLQTLEIEDEFENLEVDINSPFDPNDIEGDEYSDAESNLDSQAGLPVFGKDENDIKDRDRYINQLENLLEKTPNDIALHYKLGAMEIKKGEFSEKLKYHFTKVHKLNPRYKRHIVNQALGELLFKANDKTNARRALYFFKTALSIDNTDQFHTLIRIAQCYSILGKLENSQAAYIAVF